MLWFVLASSLGSLFLVTQLLTIGTVLYAAWRKMGPQCRLALLVLLSTLNLALRQLWSSSWVGLGAQFALSLGVGWYGGETWNCLKRK